MKIPSRPVVGKWSNLTSLMLSGSSSRHSSAVTQTFCNSKMVQVCVKNTFTCVFEEDGDGGSAAFELLYVAWENQSSLVRWVVATSSVEEIAGIPVFIIVPQLSVLILGVPVFCPRQSRVLSWTGNETLKVYGAYEWSAWPGTGVAEGGWSRVKQTRTIPTNESRWINRNRRRDTRRKLEIEVQVQVGALRKLQIPAYIRTEKHNQRIDRLRSR